MRHQANLDHPGVLAKVALAEACLHTLKDHPLAWGERVISLVKSAASFSPDAAPSETDAGTSTTSLLATLGGCHLALRSTTRGARRSCATTSLAGPADTETDAALPTVKMISTRPVEGDAKEATRRARTASTSSPALMDPHLLSRGPRPHIPIVHLMPTIDLLFQEALNSFHLTEQVVPRLNLLVRSNLRLWVVMPPRESVATTTRQRMVDGHPSQVNRTSPRAPVLL